MAPETQMSPRLKRLEDVAQGAGPVVLGTVANLDVPYKGHDLVIRALASLGEARERFVYRLIGPGDPDRLKRLAEDLGVSAQVEFAGPCPREDIPAALDGIDIYLQPSRQEGLPRAVIEAMARGCVVIGSRTGGIPELISEPWLVGRGDWKAIAALLSRIDSLPTIEAATRNHAKAGEFQMEVLEAKRRQFYDRFLAEHALAPVSHG
jgi:glycosyltransferase involved in cell wall biosynthesis